MQSTMRWIFRGLAIVAAGLTSVQPILGSFALFRWGDPISYKLIHLIVGGIFYNVTIVLAVLALAVRFRQRWTLFAVCVAQYVLTHVQLRLGLGSNEDAGLLAFHIPLGVLILLLSYLTVALSLEPTCDAQPVPERRGGSKERVSKPVRHSVH